MFTDINKMKMKDFVNKLLSNPCFKNEPKLTVEESVLTFFVQNSPSLKTTLTSNDFFPNLTFTDIESLFYDTVVEEINKTLIPEIQTMIQKRINFQLINTMLNRQISIQNFQNEMYNIILKNINRFEFRRNLDAVIRIIDHGVIDKYYTAANAKQSYISRQIRFIEKLNIPVNQMQELIKIIMIISITGYIRSDFSGASLEQKLKAAAVNLGSTAAQKSYYEKIIRQCTAGTSFAIEDIIKRSMLVHINFSDDKTLPATSRLARIFFIFGKNFKPRVKVDKGADSYEKSWMFSFRKNYKYFGFDSDLLDELYRISSENNW